MCGICGILDFATPMHDRAVIERMTETLRHRGPDDGDVYVHGPVMLGHRRLAIIDLSPAGRQPMASEDGSLVLVYNGEIYNFPELRAELSNRGHRFRGTSDTEIALHAYEVWGDECFARFNGMFALAIWDSRRRSLTLARDRFGIKPLYYRYHGGRLVFGSEIKAILAHGGPRELNWAFVPEYLYYGSSMLEQSAFAGIEKVLPGHHARFDERGRQQQAYWRIDTLEERDVEPEELRTGVRERLERAVKRHLISDVPVAVLLSGGIDSSAIATFAARHYPGRIRTFSVGFDFAPHDERPIARRLADELGAEHEELLISADNLEGVIQDLLRSHDEPFADAANIPLVLMCRQLRSRDVKVVLQGDGGDEVFAGYRHYNLLAYEWFWRLLARPGLTGLKLLPDSHPKRRLRRFLRTMVDRDPAVRLALLMTDDVQESPPERILSSDARRVVAGGDALRAYREVGRRLRSRDAVSRSLYTDCQLLLPDLFLPKVDRATMSQSIESRVPFLDAELTDFVLPIPSRYKVARLQKKLLLRRALRGTVPDYILDRPKRGFGVPMSEWLRGRLRQFMSSVLLDGSTARSALFDQQALERTVAEHVSGARDHGSLLYKALNLALWHDKYIAGPGTGESKQLPFGSGSQCGGSGPCLRPNSG